VDLAFKIGIMAKIENIKSALKQFQEAAINHANATETGEYKIVNKNYDILIKLINYLKSQNGIQELMPFLNDDNVGVRVWAAAYLLPVNLQEAKKTLESINKINGIQSLDAEMVLREWENGNLKL
jgi:hypothetical protein